MSKKKVLEIYPDAKCIVGVSGSGNDITNTYTITRIGQELSHTCTTRQAAWRSALAISQGKVSRKKGDSPGRKAKVSIQLPKEDKARIERKHGSVQQFVNHYAAKVK